MSSRSGAWAEMKRRLRVMSEREAGKRPQRYVGTGTVLENQSHGPQLGPAIAQTYPQQGAGCDIVGWDWSSVEYEEAAGVRWGDFTVVGTWDDGRLTLVEAPPPPRPTGPPLDLRAYFASRCPEPEGGWRASDPSK